MGCPFYSCTLINLFLSQRRSDERMPVNKLNNVATVLKLLEQSKVGVGPSQYLLLLSDFLFYPTLSVQS